jgi:hypothetical protein
MTVPVLPLTEYLRKSSPLYYGKLLELRAEAEAWLSYVPQTFPHYTRHTVDHSDELVRQASYLLFREGADAPTVPLSATEVYSLSASAYLHDAGMVASDREKQDILRSEQWTEWLAGNPMLGERWQAIQAIRNGTDPARNFAADVQQRYMLAEYLRVQHPRRAATLITDSEHAFGRFALGDPQLREAIALLCVSHGLRHTELDDQARFPTRREIRGESVNLRLLAILLRLADLLDLRSARACPLVLNAASPLPADSSAHWGYHQRIQHKDVSPDRIELTALCETAEEHRALRDWCQWLSDEAERAGRLLANSRRHVDWKAPLVVLDGQGPNATIAIRPTPTARYVPADWRFEFDRDAVFERLIRDVYQDPLAFIRELIQNAVDAARCRMYGSMERDGITTPPLSPSKAPSDRLEQYPITVEVSSVQVPNPLSGSLEQRTVVSVEDAGIGMSQEVVQKYLLQVGRSYYGTEDFRRRYAFTPVSQFGIGFLSVFGVSDHVEIETRQENADALRLVLTGPRNYLLVERSQRSKVGTRVTVTLREQMAPGVIGNRIEAWCRRVEFPVVVNDRGATRTIRRESSDRFLASHADPEKPSTRYSVLAFPFDEDGREGELYVFSVADGQKESWGVSEYRRDEIRKRHPATVVPEPPESIVCSQGIAVAHHIGVGRTSVSVRVDYRCPLPGVTLARRVSYHEPPWTTDEVLSRVTGRVLTEHLASRTSVTEEFCRYAHQVRDAFEQHPAWAGIPMYRAFVAGVPRLMSRKELLSGPGFWMGFCKPLPEEMLSIKDVVKDAPVVSFNDWWFTAREEADLLAESGWFVEVQAGDSSTWAARFRAGAPREDMRVARLLAADKWRARGVGICRFPEPTLIGLSITPSVGAAWILLNEANPFVEWLCEDARLAEAESAPPGADAPVSRLCARLIDVVRYDHDKRGFVTYVDQYRALPGLPESARPPRVLAVSLGLGRKGE